MDKICKIKKKLFMTNGRCIHMTPINATYDVYNIYTVVVQDYIVNLAIL